MSNINPPPKLTDPHCARQLFTDQSKGLDQLPYTAEFDKMHATYVATTGQAITVGDFYRSLMNLRKKGGLTLRPPDARPRITAPIWRTARHPLFGGFDRN